MLKIGLTGGIGSGKSIVSKVFELLGVPVYYADDASKRIYHTDAGVMAEMKKHFGADIYSEEQLNRNKLAELVFRDPEKLALLNSIVHPPTIRDAVKWMEEQTASYVIKEAALIFESGSGEGLDYIIGVHAPLSLRIKRVMERDKVTREEVLQRDRRQIDEGIKMKLCDFVILNDEQELVIPQVINLHHRFVEESSLVQKHLNSF